MNPGATASQAEGRASSEAPRQQHAWWGNSLRGMQMASPDVGDFILVLTHGFSPAFSGRVLLGLVREGCAFFKPRGISVFSRKVSSNQELWGALHLILFSL